MIEFLPSSNDKSADLFRLAHISDPHLSSLTDISWKQLLNKRLLGYLSWRLNRRHIHRLELLEHLISDLGTRAPQHLVISGDLTHIGTKQEYDQVKNWLKNTGVADSITLIPGNHDNYVASPEAESLELWSDYIRGDDRQSNADSDLFPTLRKRGQVAIIGVSSAVPTAPFFATGRVSETQLQQLSNILKDCKSQGLFRVVMIHHCPLKSSNKFRKRLINSSEFCEVVESNGAELILHGHGHHPVIETLETVDGVIPVIGVASASALSTSITKRAGYNIYEIQKIGRAWKLGYTSYSYDEQKASFSLRDEKEFQSIL